MILIAAVNNSRGGVILKVLRRPVRQEASPDGDSRGTGIVTMEGIVMSRIDDSASVPARAGRERSPLSRRSVLQGAVSAGAAGVAAAAFINSGLPAAADATAPARPARSPDRARAEESGPLVVHIRDAAAGEMDVFRGTAHIRVRDKELAARLVRASG
jgi:hypothetical protein